MVLDKVTFNPSQSVTYEPDASKQQCELVINNSADFPIMYKMKSTRPGLYKMRPVYGLINPSSEATVKLIYKGLKPPHDKVPMTDRFSVIVAPCPSTSGNVGKMWKAHKYHKKIAEHEVKRKKIHILYRGVNDMIPIAEDDGEEKETHKSQVKKGPGLVDNESAMAPTQTNDPKPHPVLLMYRKTPDPEMSFSEEENEEENNGNVSEMSNQKSTHSIGGDRTAPLNKQITAAKPVKMDQKELVPADVAIKTQPTLPPSNAGGPSKATSIPGGPKGPNSLEENGKPKSLSVGGNYGTAGFTPGYNNGGSGAAPKSVSVVGTQGSKSYFAGGPQTNQMSRPFEAEEKKTSKENN